MAVSRLYILVILFMTGVALFSGCRKKSASAIPDMRVTLASNDAKPMGAKVFRNITTYVYDAYEIENNAQPFDAWYRKYIRDHYHENGTAYILLAPYVSMRKKEAEEMKKYISRGNSMLVITDGLSDDFKEVFNMGIQHPQDTTKTNLFGLADTYKSLSDTIEFEAEKFGYYFYPFSGIIDTAKGFVQTDISKNTSQLKDGIQMKIGAGELILVTNAEALSNYFLLSGNNYQYALGLLSYLPSEPDAVYWDEFYRRNLHRGPEDRSILSAILSIPELRWAFWILIALCALAILTNIFRRQRMIPLRMPNRNTTVEFTQTIARLYYNKKDNRNIALKMVQHFMEHIRSQYYIPHQKLDNEFAAVLSGKTNQPIAKAEMLVQQMAAIQNGAAVSDEVLLDLNRQMNELLKPTVMA